MNVPGCLYLVIAMGVFCICFLCAVTSSWAERLWFKRKLNRGAVGTAVRLVQTGALRKKP